MCAMVADSPATPRPIEWLGAPMPFKNPSLDSLWQALCQDCSEACLAMMWPHLSMLFKVANAIDDHGKGHFEDFFRCIGRLHDRAERAEAAAQHWQNQWDCCMSTSEESRQLLLRQLQDEREATLVLGADRQQLLVQLAAERMQRMRLEDTIRNIDQYAQQHVNVALEKQKRQSEMEGRQLFEDGCAGDARKANKGVLVRKLPNFVTGDLTTAKRMNAQWGRSSSDTISPFPFSSIRGGIQDTRALGTSRFQRLSPDARMGSWPEAWPHWRDVMPPHVDTSNARQACDQGVAKSPKAQIPKELRLADKLAPHFALRDDALISAQSLVSCKGQAKAHGEVEALCVKVEEQCRTRMNGLDLALSKAVVHSRQHRRNLSKDESSDSDWSD